MNLNIGNMIKQHRYETVCVALALVILLALWPAAKLGSQAREKTEKVQGWAGKLNKLNVRGKDPANPKAIKRIQDHRQSVRAEAQDVGELFESKNRQDFLVPGMFPKDGKVDASAPWQFRTDYNKAIDELLNETLRAGWPERSSRRGDKDAADIVVYCKREDLSVGKWATESEAPSPKECWFAQLDLWIQQDLAEAFADLNRSSARQKGEELSVTSAAVKRIIDIQVSSDYYTGLDGKAVPTTPGTGAGMIGAGPPVMGGMPMPPGMGGWQPPQQEVKKAKKPRGSKTQVTPFTERTCDEKVDVLHFSFSVVVDSRRINELLSALSSKNLYTVLNVSISRADVEVDAREFPKFDSADRTFNPYQDAKGEGLVYGADPVVRLDIDAEALFLRSIYAESMVKEVKDELEANLKKIEEQRKAAARLSTGRTSRGRSR